MFYRKGEVYLTIMELGDWLGLSLDEVLERLDQYQRLYPEQPEPEPEDLLCWRAVLRMMAELPEDDRPAGLLHLQEIGRALAGG